MERTSGITTEQETASTDQSKLRATHPCQYSRMLTAVPWRLAGCSGGGGSAAPGLQLTSRRTASPGRRGESALPGALWVIEASDRPPPDRAPRRNQCRQLACFDTAAGRERTLCQPVKQ